MIEKEEVINEKLQEKFKERREHTYGHLSDEQWQFQSPHQWQEVRDLEKLSKELKTQSLKYNKSVNK